MYTRENYALAKAEIEKRRLDAIATAEERNSDLALESNEIREIDAELSGTGLLLFKTACLGGDIDAIRARNMELQEKRRKILVKLGYPEDYTDVHYTCKACSDTGFVGTKMCSCLKQLLITKNIQSSGMGNLIDKQSFDNFNLDVYKNNPEVHARMERNLKLAKAYADNFASRRGNLLLIGTTGTGKTHISTAIAKAIISQGFDVLYDSVQNIVNDFERDKFRSGYNAEQTSDKYNECDLLIVEDIIDSGITLSHLTKYLALKGAKSVRTCTLLDKPSRRRVEFVPDYCGVEIPDEFVVGYGLDYAEKYRNLPFVGVLSPKVYSK